MSDLKFKLDKIADALEEYKDGEHLPISVSDIHFVLGSCKQLLSNVGKLEKSYKDDMMAAAVEVDKFRNKWKEARKISGKLDTELGYHRQVSREAEKLSWWQKSSKIKMVLKSLASAKKKFPRDNSHIMEASAQATEAIRRQAPILK